MNQCKVCKKSFLNVGVHLKINKLGCKDIMDCDDCYPEIDYLCSKHRPENQCIGCLRTDQKLYACAMGILCKDCMRKNGMIFV